MKCADAWNALMALPMGARVVVIDGDDTSDLAEIAYRDGVVEIRLEMRQSGTKHSESLVDL